MYENILHQSATTLLERNIIDGNFPAAVLFAGPQGSGKLTSALETARTLSCVGQPRGVWTCECQSCKKHRMLVAQNLVLAGSRECVLEIAASQKAFLNAVANNASYLDATRYLFLRSVRKLTLRFSPVLLEGDDKLSKISALVSEIEELLEQLDFPRNLPDEKKLAKCVADIEKNCVKLEDGFLSESIPVRYIRNISAWAHIKASEGKKTVIIENADKMLEASRNALLKILEEPPEDVVFILTATRKNLVMPTILSRVRPYHFEDRNSEAEAEVIARVFHAEGKSISKYLESFLPVSQETINQAASDFFRSLFLGRLPDIEKIVKQCGGFEPRKIFRMFLIALEGEFKFLFKNAAGTYAAFQMSEKLHRILNNVMLFNQQPVAGLEMLTRSLSKTFHIYNLKK